MAAERVLDGTRPMATITLRRSPAVLLSGDGPADDVIDRNVHLALAVLSAEQVGACERVLEIATDYARTREQFGRPIGSFQAIKHKCADMLVDLEWARSASQAALQALTIRCGGRRIGLASEHGQGGVLRERCATRRKRTSRFTAASASPGRTPRTCTSGGPERTRCCSAPPASTGTGCPRRPSCCSGATGRPLLVFRAGD